MILVSNTRNWLAEASENNPNKLFLFNSKNQITYKEVWEQSISTANILIDAGVNENDHVGILFSHSKDFWICVNALWLINAIPVLLNNKNTVEDITEQINHVEIKFLLLDPVFNSRQAGQAQFSTCLPAGKVLNSFCKILLFEQKEYCKTMNQIEPQNLSLQNSALILFTSGSSGKTKAVVHTFQSLFESVKGTDSICKLVDSDIWLASLPLYHIGGFMILVRALLTGAAIAFPESLKHNDITDALTFYNPTHVSVVSTTMSRIIESNFLPNNKIKYLFFGGGPLTSDLCLKAINAGWPVIKVYGSTETCAMVSALRLQDINNKVESAGKPIGENEIIIKSGEILIRSNSIFIEYYNDDETTNAVLINGYYHSGDCGWIDEEGFLFVESRREDIIITGGENVSAKEIELVINAIDGITDTFVFPVKDEIWGQIICVAIVGKITSESLVKESLKGKLAAYKIPKQYYFVTEIPRNEMGKVKRNEFYKMINLSAP